MKRWCSILAAVLMALAPLSAFAVDDDAYQGYAADTLTINVGYFGQQTYYEKKTYTLSELEALPQVQADYTFIDNMPSVVIDHVQGVRLTDLLEDAGIDLNSVENFYFWTKDKTTDYFTDFSKSALIDTQRYCYYSLPENFDQATGTGNEYADDIAEPVDTLISLKDDWQRVIAGAQFGSDYENLDTSTRFRLIFGQTNTTEHTASRSAKWIHAINVQLGGTPTITLDHPNIEGKVGSTMKINATITVNGVAVPDGMKPTWSSSDENIATVDENGNVTIVGEGTATITATITAGGKTWSTSTTVNASGEEEEEPDPDNTVTTPDDPAEPEPSQDNSQTQKKTTNGRTGAGTRTGQGTGTNKQSSGTTSGTGNRNSSSNKTQTRNGGTSAGTQYDIVPRGTGTTVTDSSQTDTNLPDGAEEAAGGVQNWRVYKMSTDAEALADVEEDNPMVPVMGAGSLGALGLGILLRILKFRADIR